VDRRGLHIRSQAVIVETIGVAIGRAENVLSAGRRWSTEGTDDQGARVMRIDRHCRVAKLLQSGCGAVGSDIRPLACPGVQLPYRSVGHAAGSGSGAVRDVEKTIWRKRSPRWPVLDGLSWNDMPAISPIGRDEKVGSIHE
jgi:hypothetical protein